MSELFELSALALRDALARGEVGARELTEHYLDRIADRNPTLGAFLTVTAGQALAEADAADARRAAGLPLPALHGVPLAHKDLTDVAGIPTTNGSAALTPAAAAGDSPLVAVLRAAGAISLGKTQVPEFGLSSYSENLIAPPARNPLDPELSPGGSSGGSAAAVAAGLIPFAPGTDGGGSVRIPAAATGLVGLKPNRGRVPSGSGQSDLGQFVVAGPIARTAADAALLLDAMVAEPGYRATAAKPAGTSFLTAAQRTEGRFRIGVSTASPFASVFSIELDPPEGEAKLTPLAGTFRRRARARSAAELTEAIAVLRQFEYDTIRQYADYDMILTPALGSTPRPIGWYTDADADTDYERQCLYSPYTSMVNVCGLPALTLPTLTTGDGLSMGIQLIGAPSAEAHLLAVCAQLEAAPRRQQHRHIPDSRGFDAMLAPGGGMPNTSY